MSMVCPLKSTKLLAELGWVFPLYLVSPLLIFLSLGYHQRWYMQSAKCEVAVSWRGILYIHVLVISLSLS
jgi:hypothetical protein